MTAVLTWKAPSSKHSIIYIMFAVSLLINFGLIARMFDQMGATSEISGELPQEPRRRKPPLMSASTQPKQKSIDSNQIEKHAEVDVSTFDVRESAVASIVHVDEGQIPVNDSQSSTSMAEIPLEEVTRAYANVSSLAFSEFKFFAGFRNQIMSMTALFMEAKRREHPQVLLDSLKHRDMFVKKYIGFRDLFDVRHWNSFYPELPRLVDCDPILHSEMTCGKERYPGVKNPVADATKPYAFGKHHLLFSAYGRYTKRRGPYISPNFPNQVDLLIKRGALRPHPDLQSLVDDFLKSLGGGNSTSNSYMALHARVEPDMQKHGYCNKHKERNLTAIFQSLEAKFPNPPANILFMPINRKLLEAEGTLDETAQNGESVNWIAIDNLKALNRASTDGLWGGRVKVFELGPSRIPEGNYWTTKILVGALLDYFVAVQAPAIFVGTQISSFSHDIMTSRFYRGNLENYKYLPSGVVERWTSADTISPDPFKC